MASSDSNVDAAPTRSGPAIAQGGDAVVAHGLPKIVTVHNSWLMNPRYWPPNPIRSMDWTAFYEGGEEKCEYGHGATEQEAIDALVEDYPLT